MIASTLDPQSIDQFWDAVVIGAGPAGSLTAYQLACSGKNVLIIDKTKLPRAKVCGCCINSGAADALALVGLGYILDDNAAVALNALDLYEKQGKVSLNVTGSFCLSRDALDAAILTAAIEQGAHYLSGTTGRVMDGNGAVRQINLESETYTGIIHSKIVIVADGLSGQSLDGLPAFASTVKPGSRFGMGTILATAPDFYQPHRIYMSCGTGGYVGLVRLEDNRVDVATAMDIDFTRSQGAAGAAAAAILTECGLPVPQELYQAHWSGTQSLSRKRNRLAANRIFVIGDACGYPEPFTGEGISWALWSSIAVKDLAIQGIDCWDPSLAARWHKIHKSLIHGRHRRSNSIALTLRNARWRHLAISFLALVPSVANKIMDKFTGGNMHKTWLKLSRSISKPG